MIISFANRRRLTDLYERRHQRQTGNSPATYYLINVFLDSEHYPALCVCRIEPNSEKEIVLESMDLRRMFAVGQVEVRLKRKPIWPLVDLEEHGYLEETEGARIVPLRDCNEVDHEASMRPRKAGPPIPRATKARAAAKAADLIKANISILGSVAQRSVLQTPELLEVILSHIPNPGDLWRQRNINTFWRSLIDTSPSLRKTLCFTNPSTKALVPPRQDYKNYTLNPVLSTLRLVSAFNNPQSPLVAYSMSTLAQVTLPPRWRTVDAPWRELQVTTPPIKRLFLRSSWLEKYMECETGVTAGMVADLLEFQRGALYFSNSMC